jgi:hypothetical protein
MAPMVELGAWAPDQPSVSNGGLSNAYNVIPAERGYDSLPSLSSTGNGNLNTACRGALTGRARNGTNFTVAGSLARLYLATTGTLANVSNGGASPYTLTTDNWWSFVLFGNRIVASNYVDPPESYVIGSSSAFAALSSHAPRAKHLAVVKDFVVAGNLIGRGDNASAIGTAEDAVQWSALDDPTSWPQVGTNAAKGVQSDWQPLAGSGGEVTGIVGGSDYGIVFQERAVWRMDYEGGDTFFRFTPIDQNRGCWIHKAAIRVGAITYFPAEDGFMATDGLQTVPIGNEVVDRFFREWYNPEHAPRVSVAYFPEWKCVVWLFMGKGATNDTPNTVLIFNVQSARWSYGSITAEWLIDVLPFSASLDEDSTSLDSGDYSAVSLDTLVGTSTREAGAFDTTHGISSFTGTPLTAFLDTNEFEPAPGMVGTVKSLRPVYDNIDAQFFAGVRTRMRQSDDQDNSLTVLEDGTGKMSLRQTGRYLAAYFVTSGEFANFRGFDVDVSVRGAR